MLGDITPGSKENDFYSATYINFQSRLSKPSSWNHTHIHTQKHKNTHLFSSKRPLPTPAQFKLKWLLDHTNIKLSTDLKPLHLYKLKLWCHLGHADFKTNISWSIEIMVKLTVFEVHSVRYTKTEAVRIDWINMNARPTWYRYRTILLPFNHFFKLWLHALFLQYLHLENAKPV